MFPFAWLASHLLSEHREFQSSAWREAVCQAAEAPSQEDLVVRTFPVCLPRQKAAPALAFNSRRCPSDFSPSRTRCSSWQPRCCKQGGKSVSESRTAAFSVIPGHDGIVGLLLVPCGHVSTGRKKVSLTWLSLDDSQYCGCLLKECCSCPSTQTFSGIVVLFWSAASNFSVTLSKNNNQQR